MAPERLEVCTEASALQGRQGRHNNPQSVAARQAYAPSTDVKTENRAS